MNATTTKIALLEQISQRLIDTVYEETSSCRAIVGYDYISDIISEEEFDSIFDDITTALRDRDEVLYVEGADGYFDLVLDTKQKPEARPQVGNNTVMDQQSYRILLEHSGSPRFEVTISAKWQPRPVRLDYCGGQCKKSDRYREEEER